MREVGSSNSGPQVNAYLAAAGLAPGYPWCAAFVYWCTSQACRALAVPNPLPKTAYCPTLGNWARDNGILYDEPRAGDVFLLYRQAVRRFAHTGFVEAVTGDRFKTLEGNTNTDGSHNGNGVYALSRPIAERYAFVRLDAVLAAVGQPPPEPTVTLALGDNQLPVPLLEGSAWLPVRRVAEHFQVAVGWDGPTRRLALGGQEYDGQLAIRPGPDGTAVAHAAARDLAEALGLNLSWDDASRTVRLSR